MLVECPRSALVSNRSLDRDGEIAVDDDVRDRDVELLAKALDDAGLEPVRLAGGSVELGHLVGGTLTE